MTGTFHVAGRFPRGSTGPAGPRITLSNASVSELALLGDVVGIFGVANGSGAYTFTLTDDAGGRFIIQPGSPGDELSVLAALTPGGVTITVEADNGVDDPLTRS